jgi:mediator of RNA polymerase II transcription subunit 12, fungi type
MGGLRTLTEALHAMHQMCKTRGLHSRSLLSFLIEIDANRYLDADARALIDSEITAFAQVS